MKKIILFLLFPIVLLSCKNTDTGSDKRFVKANYYINDSFVGKTDYLYDDSSGLLISETTHIYVNKFVKNLYNYFKDSITVSQVIFNGSDSIHNLIILFTTGNERLVSRIKTYNNENLTVNSDRIYYYDLSYHILQINYFTGLQLFDFNYTLNAISSYKLLFPRILPPYGNDTIQVSANYLTIVNQPGINNFLLVNMFNVISGEFQTMNLELTGCSFNTAGNLLASLNFIPNTLPDYTYQYTFDSKQRVSTKILDYISPVELPPNQLYKTEYIYPNE